MAEPSTAQGSGTTPSGLVFSVLGPLEVLGHDGPVRIAPGRQEIVLAALLLDADRVVSMDYLVDLVWDEKPPSTARTQVQICVSRLRKELSGAGIDAPIATRPPGYLMRVGPDMLDLQLFNRRCTNPGCWPGKGAPRRPPTCCAAPPRCGAAPRSAAS
jgi:DNA-binding SARP family transcriptional activator